jgi:soluble lytic murein transglycosylase-like protein
LRWKLRSGLAIALIVVACQTGHPPVDPAPQLVAAPARPLLPLPQLLPLQSFALAGSDALPAAIDPSLDPLALEAQPGTAGSDATWIDAILERRAPTLGTRARAAVAAELASAEDVHGLDPLVVLSLIAQESRFDPRARGFHSALGLMQIRPFVARDVARRHGIPWKGDTTLLDPARNVAIGTAYLGEILQQFGDLELALAGYNMGPYRLQRMLARGGSPKGEYVGRILTHYADLASLAATVETGSGACADAEC